MSVIYDREKDCLVYDRKLKDGAGTKTYGLEVCKSLYLNEDFLEQAYNIRNKYFPETRGELSQKITIYNPNKIRGICELCKSVIAEETHHIIEQQTADKEGFIGHFHKKGADISLTPHEPVYAIQEALPISGGLQWSFKKGTLYPLQVKSIMDTYWWVAALLLATAGTAAILNYYYTINDQF
jgi:hypothetical protein